MGCTRTFPSIQSTFHSSIDPSWCLRWVWAHETTKCWCDNMIYSRIHVSHLVMPVTRNIELSISSIIYWYCTTLYITILSCRTFVITLFLYCLSSLSLIEWVLQNHKNKQLGLCVWRACSKELWSTTDQQLGEHRVRVRERSYYYYKGTSVWKWWRQWRWWGQNGGKWYNISLYYVLSFIAKMIATSRYIWII